MDQVDHVLYAVRDLAGAAADFRQRYGWGTSGGGEPAPGLRNLVIPLEPPRYLELITCVDPDASPPAARLAAFLDDREGPYTFAIDPYDLDAVATRIAAQPWGPPVSPWRLVGDVGPERPFFIEYPDGRAARTRGWQRAVDGADHRSEPGAFRRLEVGGGVEVEAFIGEVDVPVVVDDGPPGLRRVVIGGDAGEVVLVGD